MNKATKWTILIVAILVVLAAVPRLLRFYTEWLWFGEVGYQGIFWTVFWTKVKLGLLFGLAFLLLVLGNTELARRLAPRAIWHDYEQRFRLQAAEMMERYVARYLYLGLVLMAILIGYAVAQGAARSWPKFLMFLHPTSFGTPDPIFHRDLGFYVFKLPVYEYLWQWLFAVLIAVFIITAVVHYLDKAIRVLAGIPAFAPHVKAHLSVLLGIILLVKAWGYQINAWKLLYSPRGVIFGASYTDVHAQLPVYYVLTAIAIFCAILVLVNLHFRGLWLPVAGISFLIIASLLANVFYPQIIQRYVVAPSELERERPYITHNIKFTRQAYGLDKVEVRGFEPTGALTMAQAANNSSTIDNIRLWDYRPIRNTYQQLQELRQYYRFAEVDSDRYTINGQYRQVLLSARELDSSNLPIEAQTWQNQHLSYTHGYGLCLSPVSEIGQGGIPNLQIADIPPVSKTDLKITRPEIYFGELGNQYVIVRTKVKEFDYPRGAENRYTRYQGEAGIPLSGFLRRLAMASRFSDINIVLSRVFDPESRIMFRRTIRERVQNIAPFLTYDNDPYLVISDEGRLFWIQDAYTMSNRYPYSQPIYQQGSVRFNYLRNSVKITIDAYQGTVTFYQADPDDPVIETYSKIFPGVFVPLDQMPADLLRHIRYPEGLFDVQSEMYCTYHMRDPQVFYQKEDRWAIAEEKAGKAMRAEATMEAYYAIMRLVGEKKGEFLLMRPFTPATKKNMIAWMCAKCDQPDYGKLVVFEFPKQELVYGPMQIEALIDQDTEISKLLTLWGQRGSTVIRGNLLVIPIENTILYVEPLYLQAEESKIPQLKRVILSQGKDVHVAPSLPQVLAKLIGSAPPKPAEIAQPPSSAASEKQVPLRQLIDAALGHYQRAQERLRAGDWSGFGAEMKKLSASLNKLKTRAK